MCGICGFFAKDPARPPNPHRLAAMLGAIRHRGPDDSGTHVDQGIELGHARLSIIDVAGGRQPISNEDGTKYIVLNGEIYNYLDLRARLIGQGHIFTTNSDTETVLHLYEEEDERCVDRLHGMFAFAIWDKSRRSLFLARDRLGKKPLYYKDTADYFCFASEIKAFVVAGLLDGRYDPGALDQFLSLNYTIGPRTAFADVKKLMPGHAMTVTTSRTSVSEYWDFADVAPTLAGFDESRDAMGSLIEDSVRVRLMSEVPLGAYLSGGLDSSLIVAVMTKLTGRPVKTFTVGYEDAPAVSELEYARTVARHVGAEHHEFILKPSAFVDTVESLVWHMDEPVGEYATIPFLLLSRLAKEHVTVMLSGEGADEIFAGYPIYRTMALVERYRRLPGWSRRYVFDPAIRTLLGNRKEGKYADWPAQTLEQRYRGNGSYFTDRMRARLLTGDFQRTVGEGGVQSAVNAYYDRVPDKDAVSRMLYLDTKTWLPEDLLVKADKMSMAAAVELRVPFLDHRLVEFAAALPTGMKIRGGESKYILKKYAEALLPRQVVYRKKRGFPVPIRQWMAGQLGDLARDVLLDERTRTRGIYDPAYVRRLFDTQAGGRENYSANIWTLLVLEVWMRLFVDGGARRAMNCQGTQKGGVFSMDAGHSCSS
jgi:asparagine synthase (glutamine-hydrolysing)